MVGVGGLEVSLEIKAPPMTRRLHSRPWDPGIGMGGSRQPCCYEGPSPGEFGGP